MSDVRNAFSRIMGAVSTQLRQSHILKASCLDTPLGPMMAIADEEALYLLEFVDRRGLEYEVKCLRLKTKSEIIPGHTASSRSIENELNQYFDGRLTEFKTPLFFLGSLFQKRVWEELQKIPFGETRSYSDIAAAIGKPTACRAVARANSANQLAIIVPCHRVINANGDLGGYSAGVTRKQLLIDRENDH
jgi:AraC family transcriptional regulator, regulatory protein of adaptative response / methylated-DNA-[protein]-cysteine methyltransferase